MTYARRLGILGRLSGDAKKAKKLLSKHESCLTQSQKSLFGKKFYKALRTATKIRKSTTEISTHLSGSSRPRHALFKGSASTRKEGFRQDTRASHQPFRGGPPSLVRGGGRSVSFRTRGSNNRGYFKGKFVRFRIQKRSPESKPRSPDANQNSGGTESGGSSQCPPCIDSNGHGHLNSVQTPSVSREHFLSNWKLLTQDQFILEMVVGIQIPFTTFPHQNQTSDSTSPAQGSITLSQPSATPSGSGGPLEISGLDGYRQNLLTGGISEDTANLLRSHSWRKGNAEAYNSAWKQWSSWCGQREADPFCSTVASIADYLTELFKKGRGYHTVNIHRSAISAFHRPIDGVKVGQHDLVCRVLNARFNARPPQPRYVET